jgi:hypothetical protein
MRIASYPAPSHPEVSLPNVSILGRQPVGDAHAKANYQTGSSSASADKAEPAFIMLGLDDKAKAHASWFAVHQADAAATAAGLMDMALIKVNSKLVDIAATLPQGKLFESGKAFVPFVKRSTYDLLATHLGEDYVAAAAQRVEAAAAAAADYSKASKGEPAPRSYPDHWSKIAAGDTVLASEGHDDGWWEATVVAQQEDGSYLLRWTDWPELDQFVRSITQLGLLHPKFTAEVP